MNEFIEVKDEDGEMMLVSVNAIAAVQVSATPNHILITFVGKSFVKANISYKQFKKLLGLTKKR